MMHFIKNNLHALLHFCSPAGRDSRQAFCDIYKGSILLALFGIFICVWRNTIAMLYVREWLIISETACWVLLILFELIVLLSFICASVRRWQDLDIRIPAEESLYDLIKRPRFWEVLATEEGSNEKNKYGEAPAENPVPVIGEEDFKRDVHKKLFVDLDGFEEIK